MAKASASGIGLGVSFFFMFAVNGLSQSRGPGFAKSNAELSELSPTVLTPDGATFAIWPVIYFLEVTAVVQEFSYAGPAAYKRQSCLAAAFIANGVWLWLFTMEAYWLSCIVIAFYMVALAQVYMLLDFGSKADVFRREVSPFALRAGISVNLAWVSVASCINVIIAVGRFRAGVAPGEPLMEAAGSVTVACLVMVVLTAASLAVANSNYDGAFASAASWALFGVYRAQAGTVSLVAGLCSALCALVAASAVHKYLWRSGLARAR